MDAVNITDGRGSIFLVLLLLPGRSLCSSLLRLGAETRATEISVQCLSLAAVVTSDLFEGRFHSIGVRCAQPWSHVELDQFFFFSLLMEILLASILPTSDVCFAVGSERTNMAFKQRKTGVNDRVDTDRRAVPVRFSHSNLGENL